MNSHLLKLVDIFEVLEGGIMTSKYIYEKIIF